MGQPLGRVPHDVADGLLGVDAEEVLQDVEEGDLLRAVDDLVAGKGYCKIIITSKINF